MAFATCKLTYRDNSWDEYDTVVSASLEEVELQ